VLKSGNYQSSSKVILASGVFIVWVWGIFIPLFTNIEGYFSTRQSYGQEYIDTLSRYMTGWMCPTLLVAAFVSGIIGGFIGKSGFK
jgi:energy-coupling factor transport system substrate-specific component